MQVAALKLEVTKIKAETGRRTRVDKQDTRGVLEQVTNLQGKLADAGLSQDTLRMKAKTFEGQRDAAATRERAAREEASRLTASLEAARAEREAHQQEVCALNMLLKVSIRSTGTCRRSLSLPSHWCVHNWLPQGMRWLCSIRPSGVLPHSQCAHRVISVP